MKKSSPRICLLPSGNGIICEKDVSLRLSSIGEKALSLFGCPFDSDWFVENFTVIRDSAASGTPDEIQVLFHGQPIVAVSIPDSKSDVVLTTLDYSACRGSIERIYYRNGSAMVIPAIVATEENVVPIKAGLVIMSLFPELKRYVTADSHGPVDGATAQFLQSLPFEDTPATRVIIANEEKVSKHIADMRKKFMRKLEEYDKC